MPQLTAKLIMSAVGAMLALGVGDTADATVPTGGERAAMTCGAGLLHVVIRGPPHLPAPAPDLQVTVSGSPAANREGGTF